MGKAGAGAIDAFLKIVNPADGQTIDTDADHSWVKLYGFTQGVEIGGTTGGAGAGKMEGKAWWHYADESGCRWRRDAGRLGDGEWPEPG